MPGDENDVVPVTTPASNEPNEESEPIFNGETIPEGEWENRVNYMLNVVAPDDT